ncbi:MAG: hypothetical protein NC131_02225 [Roseburia sp.]|nr:hypothetical protein [Roseburia sp.]
MITEDDVKNLKERLHYNKSLNIKDVKLEELKDIRDVQIDTSRPVTERVLSFWAQMGNPYLFKVDDTIVKVGFTENGQTLQESLEKLFTRHQ